MRIFAIIVVVLAAIIFALLLIGLLANIASELKRIADSIERY